MRNTGAAQFLTGTPITMTSADIARVCHALPGGVVVAVHMDTINHCLRTRQALRAELDKRGLFRVRIPVDGESLAFPG